MRSLFSARAAAALREFVDLVNTLAEKVRSDPSLKKALHAVVHDSGLYAMHEDSNKEQAETRRDNLDELINAGSYVDAQAITSAAS